ncbi:hypothetical protein LCGC14_1602120 [marine sediment metagenome]|uniref:Uncharacterized protein n=1 Tax=marine sediment metagenome TaxID=412755 RepID=A0A0F9KRI1_9ZZZZ
MTPKPKDKPAGEVKLTKADMKFHKAVAVWLKARGGIAVVTGPIGFMQWPGEPESKFMVCIKVLGRRSPKKESSK